MRQQIHSQISQSEASLFLGLIQQNKFTNSSRNVLQFTSEFTTLFASVVVFFCLTVILTAKFRQ